jgi:pimeloyl-ACP methyl ester carboxylesterase
MRAAGALPSGSLVVLVHGLWLTRHAVFGWRRRFEKFGCAAFAFGYPSREPFAENVARLSEFVSSLTASNVYILGHSLGGVLAINMLAQDGCERVRRAVLAGSPVAGSLAGRRLARWTGGRWFIGGANSALPEQTAQRDARLAALPVDVGVIAGTRPLGLGRLFGALPEPNDGTVILAETHLAAARDTLVLPVSHSQMLVSHRVADQALHFFVNGRFDHGNSNA